MFVRPRGKPVRRIRTVLANRCKNEAAALTGPDRGRIGIVEEDEGPGAGGNRGRSETEDLGCEANSEIMRRCGPAVRPRLTTLRVSSRTWRS